MLESNKHVLGKYTLFGGCDETERNIARFVDSEEPGYEEDFPIVCLEILPKSEKFAEPLCHRDFLGALMNLGIERKNIGDISVMHKRAEHLTVLTDIFSPDTAADGLEICPILPSPSFLSRQKSVPLKLRAPKTDYFCRDSLRTTQEYRAYFKEDETEYRQKEPFSASGVGSLMHKNNRAYVFVLEKISGYILSELTKVKHTLVECRIAENLPSGGLYELKEEKMCVPSLRCDCFIAEVFHLSRSESTKLFGSEKVFVNGRCVSSPGMQLKQGDTVSVRGFGRFRFLLEQGKTKKGNAFVNIGRFV